MFVLIFNKDDSFFFEKKNLFEEHLKKWRQIQICNSSTRHLAIPWQLPNSKVLNFCHIGDSLEAYVGTRKNNHKF